MFGIKCNLEIERTGKVYYETQIGNYCDSFAEFLRNWAIGFNLPQNVINVESQLDKINVYVLVHVM